MCFFSSQEKIGERTSLVENHFESGFQYKERENADFKLFESGYQYQKRENTDMGTSKYQLPPQAEVVLHVTSLTTMFVSFASTKLATHLILIPFACSI